MAENIANEAENTPRGATVDNQHQTVADEQHQTAVDNQHQAVANDQQESTVDEQQRPAVDVDLLKEVIEVVRPSLQADGGDCNFVSVDKNGVVTLELTGACSGCPMSSITLSMGIERILKEHVPGVTRVVSATDSMEPETSPWGSTPREWQEHLYGNDEDDIPTLL